MCSTGLAMVYVHPIIILQVLAVVAIANGVPVLAKKLLGQWCAQPLDAGYQMADGEPLFGRSKTIRGVLLSVIASILAAPGVGLDIVAGALIGVTAMVGDLVSSFSKRRLHMKPSSMAPG